MQPTHEDFLQAAKTDLRQSLLSNNSVTADTRETDASNDESIFDGLDEIKIWAYGVGHFFNDLAGACWFNFLFYYLKRVVDTPAAATMMVVGQIIDGIATPLIGYLSDRFKSKYGQRTPWYVGGFIIFLVSFICLYQNFKAQNKTYEYVYYSFVSAFVNIGWAGVQISHMSLVPLLTCSRKRRDRLNNLRNTFTFIANFLALGLGLIVFKFMTDPPLEYKIISYVIAGIGILSSLFFMYHIREVKLSQKCKEKALKIKQEYAIKDNQYEAITAEQEGKQLKEEQHRLIDWFKMPQFYLFGICYMGVRLCTNIFGTLLPFYLVGVLKLGYDEHQELMQVVPFTVALVPLIVYLSSVFSSSALNKFYATFGRKTALSVGTIICSVSLFSFFFLNESNSWVVYILAIFIGISQPMILSTGVNFISDIIGSKAKSGAFVFGVYSLLDKFSAGIVIFFVGNSVAYSTQPKYLSGSQKNYIKLTMILIPSLSAILASLIVLGTPIKQYKKKKEQKNDEWQTNSIRDEFVM